MIGLGVGEQHLAGYLAHPGCRVGAMCDRCPRKLAEVGARHPGVPRTTDAESVLTDPSIDVVSIATYDDAHAGQVLLALEHGKHVFVEKPLCTTAADLEAIRRALAARPELALSSNLILRRSPRFEQVREWVAEGRFGELFHVEGAYLYGRLHKITSGWRGRQSHYSVVLGGAVHMVDAVQWITGRRIVEVAAFGNRIASAGSGFRFNDMVAATVRLEGGMTGSITANFGCVRPHGHGLAIYGTAATFVNDVPHGHLFASRDPEVPPRAVTSPHPGACKGDLVGPFLEAILAGSLPPVTAAEVVHSTAVCLAIERASLEGGSILVEDAEPATKRRSDGATKEGGGSRQPELTTGSK